MHWVLDDLDCKILEIVAAHHGMSMAEISREAPGLKYSTIRDRINVLIRTKFLAARKEAKSWKIFATQKGGRYLRRK